MDPKALVQRGYDMVSHVYRGDAADWNDPAMLRYQEWIAELAAELPPGAPVLDLGCGNGIPEAQLLHAAGFAVTGVDLSPVQIARAQAAVPGAQFICADMTTLRFPPASFAAIVSFYAIIHVPLQEQPALFAAMVRWLQPGGVVLATVGTHAWTGTEDDWLQVAGGTMYWSHADAATYEQWCADAGLLLRWTRFVPEGAGGHTLICMERPTV